MSYSILVVDDEEDIRDLYTFVLTRDGYKVDTAENGILGIEKAKSGNYQIIITDIQMPVCDGMTLLTIVKKLDPSIEIIVMTGYATIETAIQAMKEGAYDFILKPISASRIKAVVSKCIENINLKNENRELSEANRKLIELNEMKKKFIAITSHELRTPICGLSGYIELLDYSLKGNIEEKPESIIEEIRATIAKFIEIVNEMYDLASVDRGGLNIIKENFDLVECINLVKKEYLSVIRMRKLDIIFNQQKNSLIFKGDKKRIKHAIKELVENAIKFTPDGGKIEIELFSRENKKIKIIVKDTGIGIPQDKVKHIFERFYEVQDCIYHSTSDSDFMGGGLGIGLSLVKEITEAHGGSVEVESQENTGSAFIMMLPYNNNNVTM